MPSDLSVPPVGSASTAADVSRERVPVAPEPAAPPGPATAFPNPTLRLDPGLAMVVIEFRDDSGAVRSTIPTREQLDAYRSWERSQVGIPPPGAPSGATAAAPDAATDAPRPIVAAGAPAAPGAGPPGAAPPGQGPPGGAAGAPPAPDVKAPDLKGLAISGD